jgi:glycerophosphoryl diester phosphodiesterase
MKNIIICAALAAAACAVAGTPYFAKPAKDTFIAHRGESVDAPENTMPAYKTAVERGFGFECDIYLSADKRVFTFHDGTLTRTTAGACTKKCAEASWADEISKVDVGGWGKWKGSKFQGTRPALLEELLELAVDGRYIYVEVKPGPEIVPYIKDVFAKQKKATPKNVLFISFNRKSCKRLKELMPEYKVYWLTSSHLGKEKDGTAKSVTAEYILQGLKETGADGVDCHFNPKVITAEMIKTVRDAGYEFHVWTIDKLDISLLAFERGAQTVTTNCAKKQLDQYNARGK